MIISELITVIRMVISEMLIVLYDDDTRIDECNMMISDLKTINYDDIGINDCVI